MASTTCRCGYDRKSGCDFCSTSCSCRDESMHEEKIKYEKYLENKLRETQEEVEKLRRLEKETACYRSEVEHELKRVREVNVQLKEKVSFLKEQVDCSKKAHNCSEVRKLKPGLEDMKSKILVIQDQKEGNKIKVKKEDRCMKISVQEETKGTEKQIQRRIRILENDLAYTDEKLSDMRKSSQCIQDETNFKLNELEEELYKIKNESSQVNRKCNALQRKIKCDADKSNDEILQLRDEVKALQNTIKEKEASDCECRRCKDREWGSGNT